ncbi:MAG TPA: adenylate/guanylate cyclase domain-containing protein [Polyangiaceae bacterium]|nr:adenylate/guanylate cyclase domain-containing protein [Polyangiaceae bacterium]
MAKLILTSPEGQQTVTLASRNSLGRHPDSSIQILDKIVSKEHCRIVLEGDTWVLEDLDSLNGTFLNGTRVNGKRPLVHGDEFSLGATRARFELEARERSVVPDTALAQRNAAAPRTAGGVGPVPPDTNQTPWARSSALLATARGVESFEAAAPQRGPALVAGPGHTLLAATPPQIEVNQQGREIGTQIAAQEQGFRPYQEIANNTTQMAADYERLRLSHELSREICLERDLKTLLNKILASMFRFVRADRGVIFLVGENGQLEPGASLRRDGSEAAISVSSTIMNHVMRERASVLTHDAAMDFAGSKGRSMILNRISSAIVAPLMHEEDILGVLWLDSETLARFEQRDLEMVTSIAAQAAMFIEINILGRKVEQEILARDRFSRLLSPNVAEKVLSGDMVIQKGGQLVQECTVFNSDIRGFTHMSDGAAPEPLVEMLNEYFELMVETLFKYEGTLDKFMGDGIMALWGAPVVTKDDAVRSVECALEQMEVLRAFNSRRRSRDMPPLDIGIGIHTGPVVAGYIGSSKALSYTVIGDTANTSARLCGAAGPGEILVSASTIERLGTSFDYKELPPLQLKGKEKPFRCFAIQRSRFAVAVPVAPPNSSRPPTQRDR